MKGWKQTGSSIRFLIDSEGLGDTPNKQNCILCVQMHCLPSCVKSATDISRDVSHQKKYPISDSQESQGVHVTFLRDLWITFPF